MGGKKKKKAHAPQQQAAEEHSNQAGENSNESEASDQPTPPSLTSLLLMKENRGPLRVLVLMTIAMFTLPFVAFYRTYHAYTIPSEQLYYAGASALGTVLLLMGVMIVIAIIDSYTEYPDSNTGLAVHGKDLQTKKNK